MNIFDYAMQMEKDGENYYRQLVQSSDNKGEKTIFTMLADEEVKHFNIIRLMKSQTLPKLADSDILANTRNIFIKMQQSNDKLDFDNKQSQLYKKARDIEQKSCKFYLEKASQAEQKQKEIFLKLAEEEKKHYYILENLLQLVSRPEQWLENAEFYHSEEEY